MNNSQDNVSTSIVSTPVTLSKYGKVMGRPKGGKNSEESKRKMRKFHNLKPTTRQILLLKYVNSGMTKKAAMLKAGYSLQSADHGSTAVMKTRRMQAALAYLKNELVDAGLTTQYMAGKIKEWVDAKREMPEIIDRDDKGRPVYDYVKVPDYDTQIKGYDRWEKQMGLSEAGNQPTGPLKRKLTIEEFIMEPEKKYPGDLD